jgi:hypothetical protein
MSLWLWDYLLFSNMNKDFNPLCLWKSAVRGFEYFSKLLYVAAVNKKSSPLKATENEMHLSIQTT